MRCQDKEANYDRKEGRWDYVVSVAILQWGNPDARYV